MTLKDKTVTSTYRQIADALETAVKKMPFLPAEKAWRQNGWTVSADGGIAPLTERAVSVPLLRVWTKVVQVRENGWVGESFFVDCLFSPDASPEVIAEQLAARFKEQVNERIRRAGVA